MSPTFSEFPTFGKPLPIPGFINRLLPQDRHERELLGQLLLRVLIATNMVIGCTYLSWRMFYTINWAAWPIAIALLVAEMYSFFDSFLFGFMMWKLRKRDTPPTPIGRRVDVFIATYNEPIDLVQKTVWGTKSIRYPHKTYILDDGNRPEMKAMCDAEGVGYITRSSDWDGKDRHAKAGNLNNALQQTTGEFILIFDADQIPGPDILTNVLGYFDDPRVAFVQTPQWFYNVPDGDPFGCQAPLFYGPIQQGKDGWNAAFFCGSNAVLRREAVLQLGLMVYAQEIEIDMNRAFKAAPKAFKETERELSEPMRSKMRPIFREILRAAANAERSLKAGNDSIQELTFILQRQVRSVARDLVRADLAEIASDLEGLDGVDSAMVAALRSDETMEYLADRERSPLRTFDAVQALLIAVDIDRSEDAVPVSAFATISVTEDMATAMRLHANGWKSVYHDEVMAKGLAPDDLRSMLQQRLRWAQGTIQVMLRENPLMVKGLSIPQKLMYTGTMYSYLSGFFAVPYLVAPILYLLFGISPTKADPTDFLWHLLPFLITNQLVFMAVGYGRPTWRGQQYSLALFPLWIDSVTSAVSNVFLGRKLGFVVTPKTRQGGVHLSLVKPQILVMAALAFSLLFGLFKIAFGLTDDGLAIMVNVFWASYDLVMLSSVLDAATYQPDEEPEAADEAGPAVGPSIGPAGPALPKAA